MNFFTRLSTEDGDVAGVSVRFLNRRRVTEKKVAMKRPMMLIALLLPVMAGCESYTWVLYANPPVSDAKQGQECFTDPLGLGRQLDLTGNEAMRLGGITRVRSIEYYVSKFYGLGKECVIARGE